MPEAVGKEDESEITGSIGEVSEGELHSKAKHESRKDKLFQKFKTKIALEPEQTLRQGRKIALSSASGENIPQKIMFQTAFVVPREYLNYR